MKKLSLGTLLTSLSLVLSANICYADVKNVDVTSACPISTNENSSLDIEVLLTADKAPIDLTGKRVMVALTTNPSSTLSRISTYGPFPRTIPDDVTIISGGVSLAAGDSLLIQVNVTPKVPRGAGGTVGHVIAFLFDETGRVGNSGSCVVPIQ